MPMPSKCREQKNLFFIKFKVKDRFKVLKCACRYAQNLLIVRIESLDYMNYTKRSDTIWISSRILISL